MSSRTNSAPGFERFQPADSGVAIQFADDARERMLSEVMTGFGAVPRRGAEVGGILLGHTEDGTVWVEDVVLTACEYRRGPSFLLSEQDRQNLEKLVLDLRSTGGEKYPVGIFRSNTRDHDTVSDEDRDLFGAFFAPPEGVFMLIRPFATKPPIVSFLTYQEGRLPDSAETFLFERASAGGGRRRNSGPPATVRPPAQIRRREPATADWLTESEEGPGATPIVSAAGEEEPDYRDEYPRTAATRPTRRTWMLAPLSFIFLLLGVLLGFQSALTFYPKPKAADASALTAGLTAARKGENLHIRWNREALAITSAQGGTLEIEDGANRKSVELDASALQNGSVIYPPASDHVTLRLDITVSSGARLVETLSWSKTRE